MSKTSELTAKTHEINPDIILLTETWLNSNINNAAINLAGYETVQDLRIDRETTVGGVGGGGCLSMYERD